MRNNASHDGIAYAIISAILMATIGVFSKYMGLSAGAVTFFRLILGALFMLLFLLAKGKAHYLLKKPDASIYLNGFFLAGFILFYVQAMNYTSMANAIMIIYLAPLAAAVYAHFMLAEKLRPLTLALLFLALLGFMMMLEFNLDIGGDRQRLIGLGLAMLAMFCYCGFILVNRTISAHVFNSSFYQLLIGGLFVCPFFLNNIHPITTIQFLLLIGVGFFPGFLAIYFAVIALRKLEAATFGTMAYFEPLTVVLFGWFIFDERLSVLQITGCFLILSSGIIKAVTEKNSYTQ